jgi:hypothetical protein
MNLGEFTAQMKANIRRGDSLDDLIPGFIRKGALWLERNHTLNYMMKFAVITIDPEGDDPRFITLADTRIKGIPMFRWINDDGSYSDLTKVDPKDVGQLDTGTPTVYWTSGVNQIILGATPDKTLSGELHVSRYSSWPTAPEATHWLMDFAEDVLEAQAMIQFSKHARDAEAMAYWGKVRDDGIQGLYAAEQEFAYSNTDLRMHYNGE